MIKKVTYLFLVLFSLHGHGMMAAGQQDNKKIKGFSSIFKEKDLQKQVNLLRQYIPQTEPSNVSVDNLVKIVEILQNKEIFKNNENDDISKIAVANVSPKSNFLKTKFKNNEQLAKVLIEVLMKKGKHDIVEKLFDTIATKPQVSDNAFIGFLDIDKFLVTDLYRMMGGGFLFPYILTPHFSQEKRDQWLENIVKFVPPNLWGEPYKLFFFNSLAEKVDDNQLDEKSLETICKTNSFEDSGVQPFMQLFEQWKEKKSAQNQRPVQSQASANSTQSQANTFPQDFEEGPLQHHPNNLLLHQSNINVQDPQIDDPDDLSPNSPNSNLNPNPHVGDKKKDEPKVNNNDIASLLNKGKEQFKYKDLVDCIKKMKSMKLSVLMDAIKALDNPTKGALSEPLKMIFGVVVSPKKRNFTTKEFQALKKHIVTLSKTQKKALSQLFQWFIKDLHLINQNTSLPLTISTAFAMIEAPLPGEFLNIVSTAYVQEAIKEKNLLKLLALDYPNSYFFDKNDQEKYIGSLKEALDESNRIIKDNLFKKNPSRTLILATILSNKTSDLQRQNGPLLSLINDIELQHLSKSFITRLKNLAQKEDDYQYIKRIILTETKNNLKVGTLLLGNFPKSTIKLFIKINRREYLITDCLQKEEDLTWFWKKSNYEYSDVIIKDWLASGLLTYNTFFQASSSLIGYMSELQLITLIKAIYNIPDEFKEAFQNKIIELFKKQTGHNASLVMFLINIAKRDKKEGYVFPLLNMLNGFDFHNLYQFILKKWNTTRPIVYDLHDIVPDNTRKIVKKTIDSILTDSNKTNDNQKVLTIQASLAFLNNTRKNDTEIKEMMNKIAKKNNQLNKKQIKEIKDWYEEALKKNIPQVKKGNNGDQGQGVVKTNPKPINNNINVNNNGDLPQEDENANIGDNNNLLLHHLGNNTGKNNNQAINNNVNHNGSNPQNENQNQPPIEQEIIPEILEQQDEEEVTSNNNLLTHHLDNNTLQNNNQPINKDINSNNNGSNPKNQNEDIPEDDEGTKIANKDNPLPNHLDNNKGQNNDDNNPLQSQKKNTKSPIPFFLGGTAFVIIILSIIYSFLQSKKHQGGKANNKSYNLKILNSLSN